jgi:hypothetical protein
MSAIGAGSEITRIMVAVGVVLMLIAMLGFRIPRSSPEAAGRTWWNPVWTGRTFRRPGFVIWLVGWAVLGMALVIYIVR